MFVSSLELSEEEPEDLEDSDPEDDFVPKRGMEGSDEDSSGDNDIIDMDKKSSTVSRFGLYPRSDQRPLKLLAKPSLPPLRLACSFCSEVSTSYSQQFLHLGECSL